MNRFVQPVVGFLAPKVAIPVGLGRFRLELLNIFQNTALPLLLTEDVSQWANFVKYYGAVIFLWCRHQGLPASVQGAEHARHR
jgi:hypothetical protein